MIYDNDLISIIYSDSNLQEGVILVQVDNEEGTIVNEGVRKGKREKTIL